MANNHMTARSFVGTEIRFARESQEPKLSRARLAEMLYVSESLIAKWENGLLVPAEQHLTKLIEALALPEMLVRIIERLVSREVSPEWFGKWPEIEGQATSLSTFQPTVVPGLLQVEDYARAILRAANLQTDLGEALRSRLKRKEILEKDDSPMYVALLSESVLRHNVGGPQAMCEQLLHLAEKAECDNIILQIVPNHATACAGFLSGFVIANSDGEELAYIDNQLDGDVIDDPEGVARLRRFLDTFRGDALSRADSIELIRKVADQWKSA